MHKLAIMGVNAQLVILLILVSEVVGVFLTLVGDGSLRNLLLLIGAGGIACCIIALRIANACANIGPVMGKPVRRSWNSEN